MRKIAIILISLILFSVGILSGCNSTEQPNEQEQTPQEKILGTWETETGDRWTFTENTVIIEENEYPSNLTDKNFSMHWGSDEETILTYSYRFSTNDTLMIHVIAPAQYYDPNELVLYRVK
jgi:hypothetical protein